MQADVLSAKSCGHRRGIEVERNDGDRKAFDQIMNDEDAGLAATKGVDQTLRERGCRHCQPMTIAQNVCNSTMRAAVLRVVRVEQTDHHTRVKVDYSHSARNVFSSSR